MEWPYELGWIYVVPAERDKGLSKALVACALEGLDGNVFATARTDNEGSLRVLKRFDFVAQGSDYEFKESPGARIQVFVRTV